MPTKVRGGRDRRPPPQWVTDPEVDQVPNSGRGVELDLDCDRELELHRRPGVAVAALIELGFVAQHTCEVQLSADSTIVLELLEGLPVHACHVDPLRPEPPRYAPQSGKMRIIVPQPVPRGFGLPWAGLVAGRSADKSACSVLG